MKSILFISYDGMTDPLGQSQVIPYLAGLTRYGYRFTILSCDKPDAYTKKKDYVLGLLKGLPIEWVSIPYHKNPPVLSSFYDYRKLKQKAKQLHRKQPFDMVHTRPGVPTLVALWLKNKFGIRFFNDVRGFWADERVDGGMWNTRNPLFNSIYRFFKKHEYECLEKADGITCLTYAAREEMLGWKNISKQPLDIEVIPCSADLDLFNPDKIDHNLQQQFIQQLGIIASDMLYSYLGSIGGWYLTEEMMRFCKKLADKNPAAKFLFISPHRHEQIRDAALQQGLAENRLITINAARHEVPVLLSLSSFSIFFIKPCYSKISSSPTKHGEIMAMGIPVITNSGVGDVKRISDEYNAGYVVDDFTDASFDEVIAKLQEGKPFSAERIRAGAKAYYNLQTAVEKYASVYSKIFGN